MENLEVYIPLEMFVLAKRKISFKKFEDLLPLLQTCREPVPLVSVNTLLLKLYRYGSSLDSQEKICYLS